MPKVIIIIINTNNHTITISSSISISLHGPNIGGLSTAMNNDHTH